VNARRAEHGSAIARGKVRPGVVADVAAGSLPRLDETGHRASAAAGIATMRGDPIDSADLALRQARAFAIP